MSIAVSSYSSFKKINSEKNASSQSVILYYNIFNVMIEECQMRPDRTGGISMVDLSLPLTKPLLGKENADRSVKREKPTFYV